jgi:hypothetical protein
MTDATDLKVLLMVTLVGALVGATYVPQGFIPALASRAMALVRSAIAWPDRAMQRLIPQRIPALARSQRSTTNTY